MLKFLLFIVGAAVYYLGVLAIGASIVRRTIAHDPALRELAKTKLVAVPPPAWWIGLLVLPVIASVGYLVWSRATS